MKKRRFRLAEKVVLAAFIVAQSAAIVAEEGATPASDKAPLGSPDFYPSPERPVGWRGDGSGRFPGATPPTTWSRRLKDITSEIVVQAAKPTGEPSADSNTLAYFTVKDWLIAGPFPAPDPEKDIEKDFLGGEAKVQPDAGDMAGNSQWKVHRAYEGSQSYRNHNERTGTHLFVDFVHAFGKLIPPEQPGRLKFAKYTNLDKRAAYAHTYLYAPRETEVVLDMKHGLPALKLWLNGTPQPVAKSGRKPTTLTIHLNKGWNRLLIKAICDKAQKPWRSQYADPKRALGKIQWRFAMYVRPAGPGPMAYETRNIAWMLKLTGRNTSQPIVVGNKVFVGSGDTDLICLDKESGKVLWLHTVTYRDAMPDEEWTAAKEKAAPLLEKLDKANREMVALLNANISPQGLDTGKQTAIDKTIDTRNKLARSVHRALSTGKKGKLYDNEVSAGNATPTSDGKLVYWVVQGNGGYLTSAFDLDGKRLWSSFEYQKHAGEHGSHRSPLLCDGKLLVSTNEKLIAYDAATGKELWRTPGSPSGHGVPGTPVPVQVKGKKALQTQKNLVSLEGEVLSDRSFVTFGCFVPVVESNVLYSSSNRRHQYWFEAFAVPLKGKSEKNWRLGARALYGGLVDSTAFFYVASPLYVDGLIYQIEMSGILLAIDTRARKRVYCRQLDGYNFQNRMLYGYCASPTLAGKNIYLLDGAGHMTILKPGAEGTVVGKNTLQNLSNMKYSAPGRQECFYAGMFFEGRRMFVHSDNYMYCIEKNGKNLTSATAPVDGRDSEGQPHRLPVVSSQRKNDKGQAHKPDPGDRRDPARLPQAPSTVPNAPALAVHSRTFRGSNYGDYPKAQIPLEWSSKTKPRWEVEIGDGYGSPVISDRHIFVTAEPDTLLCVDSKAGKILWKKTNGFDQLPADQAAKARKQETECGYATPTPYTDGKRVWAVFGTGVVTCFDMKGKRQWIRYIDKKQTNEYGRSASPVMADGKLIVTITQLMALGPKTGKTLWEQPKAKEAYGTPAVIRIKNRDVLVTPTGHLVAANDGRVLAGGMGTSANTSPVVHAGVVYFCDSETTAWKLPGSLEAKPSELWLAEIAGEFFASPVLHDGILYCVANEGRLYAINATDGKLLYEEELVAGDTPMNDETEIYPSLILANGHLLVTNNAGQTAVVKPGPKYKLLRINELAPGSGSTPAIDGNNLLIRSGSKLIIFGEEKEQGSQ